MREATSKKPYAAGTPVPVVKSQEQIQATIKRYGATKFGFVADEGSFSIAFVIPPPTDDDQSHPIQVRFTVYLPSAESMRVTEGNRRRATAQAAAAAEAEERRLWRSLAAGIKAKLILVDDGIETVDQALYAHIVNPGTGRTVYEETASQMADFYRQIGSRRGVFQLALPSAEDGRGK